ncbi:MAG: hypothetical protein IH953_07760 [Chloroflexi bacterium]|nr:hypothetical protein [Chloroflexota bacterium]
MVSVYYSPAYVGSGYSFDTTRKAGWIAESLSESPIPRIELVEPDPLTRDQVAAIHDSGYIRAIETGHPRDMAESQGFVWDAGLWPMVLASNGGVVAAALAALERGIAGSLSSGLHHARNKIGSDEAHHSHLRSLSMTLEQSKGRGHDSGLLGPVETRAAA